MADYPSQRYRNARDVLPAELLREVQKYYTGKLHIPALKRYECQTGGDKERNDKIVRMFKSGKTLVEIAKEVNLCRERVRQIVKESPVKK